MRLNKICILIFTCCYNDHLYLDNTIIMCINLNSNKAPHAVVNFFFFFFFGYNIMLWITIFWATC